MLWSRSLVLLTTPVGGLGTTLRNTALVALAGRMGENYGGGRCLQKIPRSIYTSRRREDTRERVSYEKKVIVAINVDHLKVENYLIWNPQIRE